MSIEWQIAKKYLLSSKRSVVRTIAKLAVSGVAIGVMAMVVVLSVMNGFDDAIRGRFFNVEPHLRIKNIQLNDQNAGRIKKVLDGKGEFQIYSNQDVILRTFDGSYTGAVARGVSKSFVDSLKNKIRKIQVFEQDETRPLVDPELRLEKGEVAVGIDLAHSLGIFSGHEVNVVAPESLLFPQGELPIYERVRVKALLRTDVPGFDAQAIIYDPEYSLKRLSQTASLETGYDIELKRLKDVDFVSAGIKREFQDVPKIQVLKWEDLNPALFYSLKMEKFGMGLFLGLTILVSSFSIMTVLFLMVTDRKIDIGILRTLGATERQISSIFIRIGFVLGSVGILGGMFLGLLICYLLDQFPTLFRLPRIYYDTTLPVSIDWRAIFGIVILGLVLSLVGALYPAKRASRLQPVDAIRS